MSEASVQVSTAPQKYQNYIKDVRLMRRRPLEDEGITFRRAGSGAHSAHSNSTPDRQPAASGSRNRA